MQGDSQIAAWELRMMLNHCLGRPVVALRLLQQHCQLEIMLCTTLWHDGEATSVQPHILPGLHMVLIDNLRWQHFQTMWAPCSWASALQAS